MPVYICQAGSKSAEPWRHGLQVYAAPFSLANVPPSESLDGNDNTASADVANQLEQDNNNIVNERLRREQQFKRELIFGRNNDVNREEDPTASLRLGMPVRRIRHAEVVLVDDVCIAFERHWLRLRWPGYKGGFAGYVALGKIDETEFTRQKLEMLRPRGVCLFF